MWLVAGLGNPGPKYADTRHNFGFRVAERLAERAGAGPFREKFRGRFTRFERGATSVIVLEPGTFMNLSGESVGPAMKFFRVTPADLLVVYDELDLPFGTIRLKV